MTARTHFQRFWSSGTSSSSGQAVVLLIQPGTAGNTELVGQESSAAAKHARVSTQRANNARIVDTHVQCQINCTDQFGNLNTLSASGEVWQVCFKNTLEFSYFFRICILVCPIPIFSFSGETSQTVLRGTLTLGSLRFVSTVNVNVAAHFFYHCNWPLVQVGSKDFNFNNVCRTHGAQGSRWPCTRTRRRVRKPACWHGRCGPGTQR